MHQFASWRSSWLVISIFLASFISISTATAQSSSNESVTWIWPEVNVGSAKVTTNTETYNTLDTLNASWTSNLDFNPFLVVWCMAPHGWVANQSGSVPSSGWHLVPLNLGIDAPYPLSCHLGFDDLNHRALTNANANSGNFNITNVKDNNPQIVGQSTSMAADKAAATTSTTGAVAGATTVIVQSTAESSGVSGGAIAGIVIAALLGIGLILGALLYLCVRKRRRARQRNDAEKPFEEDRSGAMSGSQDFTMVGEMAADPKPKAELFADTEPVLEKDGKQRHAELPTEREPGGPVEMEGNNTFTGRLKGKSFRR